MMCHMSILTAYFWPVNYSGQYAIPDIPNNMQVRTSRYAAHTQIHLIYTNVEGFWVPLSLHTITHLVSHSRPNLYLSMKKRLTLITLHLNPSFSHLTSSYRTVSMSQRNTHHWPTCIIASLMKPFAGCSALHHPSKTNCLLKLCLFTKPNCCFSRYVELCVLFQRAIQIVFDY